MKNNGIKRKLAEMLVGAAAVQVKNTVGRSWPLGMHEVKAPDEIRKQVEKWKEGKK